MRKNKTYSHTLFCCFPSHANPNDSPLSSRTVHTPHNGTNKLSVIKNQPRSPPTTASAPNTVPKHSNGWNHTAGKTKQIQRETNKFTALHRTDAVLNLKDCAGARVGENHLFPHHCTPSRQHNQTPRRSPPVYFHSIHTLSCTHSTSASFTRTHISAAIPCPPHVTPPFLHPPSLCTRSEVDRGGILLKFLFI